MVSNRPPFFVSVMNPLMRGLLRVGVPMGPMALLTVKGRKTGRRRTTPVGVLESDGHRYVFGTFGEVDWVRNLRNSGEAVLSRGRRKEPVRAVEVSLPERASVTKRVLGPFLASRMQSQFLSMGYDLPRNPTDEDYTREAGRHPGFELLERKESEAPEAQAR